VKLYDGGRAPNPRRVRVFLAEKGIAMPPLEQIDIGRKEHKTGEFAALNPLQRIPTLVLDDGTAIAESVAICRYFEGLHPEPLLFGRDTKEAALVEMWQRRIEFELLMPVAMAFRHAHPAMAELEVPQVPAWGEANRQKVGQFLLILDRHLAGREFLLGEYFSIAEITGLIALDFMRLPKLAIPEDLVEVRRWHAALAARPSASA
jgi:glutathione S-transferase